MATPETPIALRVARTFAAPRDKVFRAWIDPEAVKKWFAPTTNAYWKGAPELDPRPGGQYRFTVVHEGRLYSIHGTYREVKAPEKLVFTWRWENDPLRGDSGDTLVTVEFFDRGGETEVVLTHEKFPNEAARDEHAQGWPGCFDEMEKLLS